MSIFRSNFFSSTESSSLASTEAIPNSELITEVRLSSIIVDLGFLTTSGSVIFFVIEVGRTKDWGDVEYIHEYLYCVYMPYLSAMELVEQLIRPENKPELFLDWSSS